MLEPEARSAAAPPARPRFQFSLATLLLLFVVLGSSLAVFGTAGVFIFGLVIGLAVYLYQAKTLRVPAPLLAILVVFSPWLLVVVADMFGMTLALLLPEASAARETGDWTPYLRAVAALAVWIISIGLLLLGTLRRRKNRKPDSNGDRLASEDQTYRAMEDGESRPAG